MWQSQSEDTGRDRNQEITGARKAEKISAYLKQQGRKKMNVKKPMQRKAPLLWVLLKPRLIGRDHIWVRPVRGEGEATQASQSC